MSRTIKACSSIEPELFKQLDCKDKEDGAYCLENGGKIYSYDCSNNVIVSDKLCNGDTPYCLETTSVGYGCSKFTKSEDYPCEDKDYDRYCIEKDGVFYTYFCDGRGNTEMVGEFAPKKCGVFEPYCRDGKGCLEHMCEWDDDCPGEEVCNRHHICVDLSKFTCAEEEYGARCAVIDGKDWAYGCYHGKVVKGGDEPFECNGGCETDDDTFYPKCSL